jgi:hypothetical protein
MSPFAADFRKGTPACPVFIILEKEKKINITTVP